MMQNKLLSNMALIIAVNLLVKPFWILFVDLGVQDSVGYETYGDYVSMFNLALILTMLLDFGINNLNSSTIANNPEILSRQFSELFSLKIILSFIYLLLTILLAYIYGFSGQSLFFVALLGICQVVAHFSTFVRSSISGLQLFKTDSFLSALDRLIMIILGLIMLFGVFISTTIQNYIYIQLVGYITVFCVGIFILSRHLTGFTISFKSGILKDMLNKTYPYAILAFIMLLYTRIDVLLMKKLLIDGDLQNGIYARAYRLLEASTLMIGTTAAIMLPLFSRMLANKDSMEPIIQKLSALVLIPVVIFSVWCSIYHVEVMKLLSPDASSQVSNAFAVLMLAFIPYTCMYIFGSMLTAKAEMKTLIVVAIMGLFLSVLLNLLLIPKMGAIGAAITTLCTQSVVGFGKLYFAFKRININMGTRFFIAFSVTIVGLILLLLTMYQLDINYWWAAINIFCVAVLLIFSTQLLSFQVLKNQLLSVLQAR
jgi:O-antigen/teichoic acid export membrane protein